MNFVLSIRNQNQCLCKYKANGYIPPSDLIVDEQIYNEVQTPALLTIKDGKVIGWNSFEPEPEAILEPEKTEAEKENDLLKAQVAALSEQNDFQEELIVELANVVYA